MPARKAASTTVDEADTPGVLDDSIAPETPDIPLGDLDEATSVKGEKEGVDYEALAKLRAPFAAGEIGLLPRAVSKDDKIKFQCKPGNQQASADGKFCGGYHARSFHLDFVGHAALTNRFLNADPTWSWRPLAFGPDGLPLLDKMGGMWIELTIGGVTRLGYGDAQGKSMSTTSIKEIIGDALRNAGMRFGGALNLWHKGDLFENAVEQGKIAAETGPAATTARATRQRTAPAATPAVQPAAEPAPQAQPPLTAMEQKALGNPPEQSAPAPEPAPEASGPVPPDGWRDDLKFTKTVAMMGALYKRAEAEGWWIPSVQVEFTKHRAELERAAQQAAAEQVNSAFVHPDVPPEPDDYDRPI